MNLPKSARWLLVLSVFASVPAWARVHHELSVRLNPERGALSAEDRLQFERPLRRFEVRLHAGLRLEAGTPEATITLLDETTGKPVPMRHYEVRLAQDSSSVTLRYSGAIQHPVQDEATPGTIAREGVHLSGESAWFAQLGQYEGLTFDLTVSGPESFHWVSQGRRMAEFTLGGERVTRFLAEGRQQEIHLEGAAFHRYEDLSGTTPAFAFLRTDDPALARRYLDATGPFIEMYSRLIGPYPYSQFSLVENFFESGYGMPSYTLLGSSVLRLPFLLQSSYPHEILHNWWGNSVYVDEASGNWCEGLTSYLADHLLQEQSGAGVQHRREILRKFTNYVTEANDFPLERFRYRFDEASAAVGYGKGAMFFHMLRIRLGDEIFRRGLRRFYSSHRFTPVGFAPLGQALSQEAGVDLADEFRQWTERTGAPRLRLDEASSSPSGSRHRLRLRLSQVQPEEAFTVRIPVAIHLEGRSEAFQTVLVMEREGGRSQDFSLLLPTRPVQVEVDPEFDIFRRLGVDEIPPSVSQLLGAEKSLIVLPSGAPASQLGSYLQLAEAIQRDSSGTVAIHRDDELEELPSGSATWILGAENRFALTAGSALAPYGVSVTATEVAGPASTFSREDHAFVLTARALGWIVMDRVAGAEFFQSLGRKLRHYGKFGHATFQSNRAINVGRGEWPVLNSSLSLPISQEDGVAVRPIRGRLAPREALIAR